MKRQQDENKTVAGMSAQMSEESANSGRRGEDNRSSLHVASRDSKTVTATTTTTTQTTTTTTTATTTTTTMATTTATTAATKMTLTRQDAAFQSGDTPKSTDPLMDLSALEEGLPSQGSSDSEMDTETEESLLKETEAESQSIKSKKRKSAKQVAKSGYKSSVKFLRKMDAKDVSSLTDREKRLIKKHKKVVKAFEKRYPKVAPLEAATTSAPLSTSSNQGKEETKETEKGEKRQTKTNQAPSTSAARTFKVKGKAKETEKGEKRLDKTTQAPSTSKVTQKLSGNSTGETKPIVKPKTIKSEGRHMVKSNPKRIRSADDETAGNSSKRAKTSLASSEELTLAIIDRSDPDGKLSKEKWLKVEAKILEAMLAAGETADAENICKFDGAGWRKGVKVVGCSNKESHDFLTSCIRNLGELWDGARIEVIPAASLPLRELVHVWVPPPVLEVDSILRLISMQNKGLCTSEWHVLSSKPREKGGLDLKIVVDRASAATIRAAAGVVKFGLGSLKFIISSNEGSRKAKDGAD